MAWAPILVAGLPPVALLLAVELLGHRRMRGAVVRDSTDDTDASGREPNPGTETRNETTSRTETSATPKKVITLAETRLSRRTAEQVMWDHYQHALAARLPAPSGAELDKIAQTNNYGRAVLRKWQRKGRTHSPTASTAS